MNDPYENQVDLPVDSDQSLRDRLKKHLGVPENANRLVQEWLKNIVVTGGGDKPIRHFEIQDRNGLVEEILEKNLKRTLKKHIHHAARKWALKNYGHEWIIDNQLCHNLIQYFERTVHQQHKIHSFQPSWESGLTLHRYSHEPADIPTPLLDRFGARQSDWEFVQAWYYGLYSGEYRGRQNIYNFGDGEMGRSTTFRLLNNALFGRNKGYAALSVAKDSIGSRFIYAACYEKRLPDCMNERWISSDVYKQVTGGDDVPIEHKGKPQFTAQVRAGILTLSNSAPVLSSSRAELSRTVPILCKPFGPGELVGNPEEQLEKEIPGFLYQSKQAWGRLSSNDGYEINLSDTTKRLIENLVSNAPNAISKQQPKTANHQENLAPNNQRPSSGGKPKKVTIRDGELEITIEHH